MPLCRNRFVAGGVSGRVALLCLLIVAPFLALLLAGAMTDRRLALQAASVRVLDLARLGTQHQREMVAETAAVLHLLAGTPDVRAMVPAACDQPLAAAASADPRVRRIVVLRPDGTIACSSEAGAPRPNVGDRGYFRRALAAVPGAPPAVDIIASRVSGKAELVAALPLPAGSPEQPSIGVIAVVLNMDWLSQLAARIPDPIGYVALVIDPATGSVLGSSPVEAAPLGKDAPALYLQHAFAGAPKGGLVTVVDWPGTPMIFGVAPIAAGERQFLLAVGLARRDVLITANGRIRLGAGLALAAMLTAMGLTWAAACILVLRPIDTLVAATDRLGAGDLAARAPNWMRLAELRALGLAFNRMAARLQERTRQLAATQAELAESEAHHRLLADNATDMITRFGPDFRRRYISPACRDLLGYKPAELVGLEPGGIVHPDDWLLLDATLNAPLKAGQETARATYRALRKDGRCIWLESRGRRLPDGSGYVVVTRDVSERKAFEQQLEAANSRLEELATLDPLTGLANRRRFDEMLTIEHGRAQRLGISTAVMMIDADNFKSYNDLYGHPAGDLCLQKIANAIESVLRRPGDMAARWGGEEFVVLLPGMDASGAIQMAHCLRAAVRALGIAHANGKAGMMTVSLGVAAAGPGDWREESTLVAAADQALYAAKRSGRDMVRIGPLQANHPPD